MIPNRTAMNTPSLGLSTASSLGAPNPSPLGAPNPSSVGMSNSSSLGGANASLLAASELDPGERPSTPFELGFKAGRTEGLISLIEAVASALSPDQEARAMREDEEMPEMAVETQSIAEALPLKTRASVLVVDDDSFNLDLLEDTFEDDYDVISASDGLSAIDVAMEQVPDLILLDVMMPGVNGYEVCKRLKAQTRTCDIPIIFITGLGDLSAETRGLELGAVDYVTKPINPASVRARVKNQIKLKWAMDKLVQVSGLEQTLRENLLNALEAKGELVYD